MKKTIFAVTALFLGSGLVWAAEKIIIQGEPVVLEQRGEVYYVPNTIPQANYHYVTVGDTQRVCYLEPQPTFVGLDLLAINVDIGGERATWNCYNVDPNYFIIGP